MSLLTAGEVSWAEATCVSGDCELGESSEELSYSFLKELAFSTCAG